MIERLGPMGVSADVLFLKLIPDNVDRLENDPKVIVEGETNASIRRAILLSLGEYGVERLSEAERRANLPLVLQLYRYHSDPGIHGAAEWLLRQWGEAAQLKVINKNLATGKVEENRRWYINRQDHTMIVIPGPVEFLMGSPYSVLDPASEITIQHKRKISRSFGMASKEVTVEQFLRFRKESEYEKTFAPTLTCPINLVLLVDAAAYCNWLSEQDGIPKDQWCYLPNDAGKYEKGMKMAPNYLQRAGYRLPTEAEWEYACRAGAEAAYAFGETAELLGKYAWYSDNSLSKLNPVGLLKPNDFGLYDMHGNAWEWTQNKYMRYPNGTIEDDEVLVENDSDLLSIFRMLRGGAFNAQAWYARSAARWQGDPSNRAYVNGFRVARTITP